MKTKYLIAILLILVLPVVTSESSFVFKQQEQVDLRIPVFDSDNSPPSAGTTCTVDINEPDGDYLVVNRAMDINTTTAIANITTAFPVNGEYKAKVSCDDGTTFGFSTFNILVTPSGESGLIGFYFMVILLVYGVFAFGLQRKDVTITLLGTFGLYLLGLYILFFGLDIYKNYLTDGFAWVTLGVAMYVSVVMANEYITL